jgi:hypothetical protein
MLEVPRCKRRPPIYEYTVLIRPPKPSAARLSDIAGCRVSAGVHPADKLLNQATESG